jgi:Putative prokaryotic signal transducing protein
MNEIVRTNDAILINALEALLKSANIACFVADQNMSVMEGSLGFLPRRLLVTDDDADRARKFLREAGYGDALKLD